MIYQFRVAGVTFEGRQKLIAWAAGVSRLDRMHVRPMLQVEPGNPHDPNAISVLLLVWRDSAWHHVQAGYVPRTLTAAVRGHMLAMRWAQCSFSYNGGNFGVSIMYGVEE